MTRFQWKRTTLVLLAATMVVWVFWLFLPRALGLAAERWLDLPGLESLRVEIDEIGVSRMRLREVTAVYRNPGGHRFRVALHGIALYYSPSERRLQRLDIARGKLEVAPGKAAATSSWPHIEWPTLPLDAVRIDDLQVTLHIAEQRSTRVRGSFELRQLEGGLQSDFATEEGQARLTASAARDSGDVVEFHAEWLPKNGPAAHARLRIGRDPTVLPARLTGQAMLPQLAGWAKSLGIDLPLEIAGGRLSVKMEAILGDSVGTLRTLSGDAEMDSVRVRITQAAAPIEFALAGTLGVSWQEPSLQIDLRPGLQWRIDVGGKQPLQANGRLSDSYRLRHTDGELRGEDAFPFALYTEQWGYWEGAVQRLRLQRTLSINTGEEGWSAAAMQMRIKGGIKQWRHDAFHATGSKAEGTVALNWSRSNGVRAELALQAGAEQLAWIGNSPVKTGRMTWKVNADATARTGIDSNIDFWRTLELNGEAGALPITVGVGAAQTLKLGPTHLKLSRFRPGGQSGVPSANNAEGELTISADTVSVGTSPAPGLQTRLRFDKGVLRSDGSLSLRAAELLRFSGSHAISSGCGEAVVSARQSLPELAKALQPRAPSLVPLDLRAGDAEGRFTLDWCLNPTATFDMKGTLQMRDAALGWDKAWIEGVQGSMQLEGLNPVRGRIDFSARSGELATGTRLADLNLDLALGPHTLSVRTLHARLLGGTVRSGPLTVDWPLGNQPLPLEIRSIDLGQLLALMKVPGLSGSGQLDGTLPFVPHAGSVEIRDGHLSSQGAGTLRYAPTLALPENLGLQALRNFHFRQFDMQVHYAADGAYRTQTMLEGSNPDFYSGYPIRFGLNINGTLPGLFRAAIFSGDFNRHILEQLQSGKLE